MNCMEAYNSIESQRREFAYRLYRWAEQDLENEVASGFARIRKVKSSWVFHYLDFLHSIPEVEQLLAARALLRSSIVHRSAREQLGLTLSLIERRYVQDFQKRFYPIASQSESEKRLLSVTAPDTFEIDRDRLEELLLSEARNRVHTAPVTGQRYDFQQKIGDWYVQTALDARSVYQLRYGHTITARPSIDLCPVQLKDGGISLLGWLGIHPSTTFNLLRESDLLEAATVVADAIEYFISTARILLEGLHHDVPKDLETVPID